MGKENCLSAPLLGSPESVGFSNNSVYGINPEVFEFGLYDGPMAGFAGGYGGFGGFGTTASGTSVTTSTGSLGGMPSGIAAGLGCLGGGDSGSGDGGSSGGTSTGSATSGSSTGNSSGTTSGGSSTGGGGNGSTGSGETSLGGMPSGIAGLLGLTGDGDSGDSGDSSQSAPNYSVPSSIISAIAQHNKQAKVTQPSVPQSVLNAMAKHAKESLGDDGDSNDSIPGFVRAAIDKNSIETKVGVKRTVKNNLDSRMGIPSDIAEKLGLFQDNKFKPDYLNQKVDGEVTYPISCWYFSLINSLMKKGYVPGDFDSQKAFADYVTSRIGDNFSDVVGDVFGETVTPHAIPPGLEQSEVDSLIGDAPAILVFNQKDFWNCETLEGVHAVCYTEKTFYESYMGTEATSYEGIKAPGESTFTDNVGGFYFTFD